MNRFTPIVLVGALSAVPVFAADGQISRESLTNTGLGQMTRLSDAQGAKIRAKFAFTFSSSTANGITNSSPGFNFATSSASNLGAHASGFAAAFGK